MDRPHRHDVVLVAALALVALALRCVHLDWSLPAIEEEALPMKKAFEMWGWLDGDPNLDPETAGWPSLSFYVHLLWQIGYYGFGRVAGWFGEPLDLWVSYQFDPTTLVLSARALNAAVSTVPVVIAWTWARRLGANGWIAAGLVALSPMMIRHAQLIEPDALVAMFSAVAMGLLPRVLVRGDTRSYVLVAVFAGLGAASKYTPVLLCASLYVLHLVRLRREGRSVALAGFDDARLGWAALASVLAFCVTSPYTFADLEVLRRDVGYQLMHMSEGHFGHAEQGVGYVHYLGVVLPRALGWPGFVLALAGIAVMARRRSDEDLAWLAAFVPMFLVLGSLSTQFDRYMLPLVLPLAVAAVVAVAWIVERRPSLAGRGRAVAIGAAVMLFALPSWGSARFLRAQGATSTQQAAADWFATHAAPDTTTIVTERYGPHLLEDPRLTDEYDPIFARLDDEQSARLFDRPFFVYQIIPMYSARVQLTAYYYDVRHWLAYDYVVTSGSVRRRYEGEPRRFERQVQFYRDLDTYAEVAADFPPGHDLRGPRVTVYRWPAGARARIEGERGTLDVAHYREWGQRLHRPDFLAFAEQVAVHAETENDHARAALYYEILSETSDETHRLYWIERVGVSSINAEDLDTATQAFNALLQRSPDNVVALGNLGLIAERRGRLDEARVWYQRCMDADREGTARSWAERRLRGLETQESADGQR